MSDQDVSEHFVEIISNMSHANGVFRITLAQQESEQTVRPVTRLLIPANQLGKILQGLNDAAGEIGRKVKEKIDQQDEETAEEEKDSGDKKKK